jgi:hypothetical protein
MALDPRDPLFSLHAFYFIPDWSGPLCAVRQQYHRGPPTNELEKLSRIIALLRETLGLDVASVGSA